MKPAPALDLLAAGCRAARSRRCGAGRRAPSATPGRGRAGRRREPPASRSRRAGRPTSARRSARRSRGSAHAGAARPSASVKMRGSGRRTRASPVLGVPAGEDGSVVVAVDLAVQAQLGGQLADPLARRLAGLRVVVLAAFGDGFDPVARVPAPDLRHSHHTPVVQRERLLHRPNCRVPSVSGCWGCGCGGASRRAGCWPMKRPLASLPLRLGSCLGVLALTAWPGWVLLGWLAFDESSANGDLSLG